MIKKSKNSFIFEYTMHRTEFIIPAAILLSFLLTYSFIPSIIKIAKIKHLYDNPDERKLHGCSTPNLGGIAIFSAFLIFVYFLYR